MPSTRRPLAFLACCLILFFLPGVGDFRWVGFVLFLYVGFPWYILAVKDKVLYKQAQMSSKPKLGIYSPTLFFFGLVSAILGVTIDIFLVYLLFQEPSALSVLSLAVRIAVGIPIFGFGAYLLYLSLGLARDET